MAYFRKSYSKDDLASPEIVAATALQNEYRHRIKITNHFAPLKTIAGIDTGYDLEKGLTKAVVVLLEWPSLELRESVIAYAPTNFPYIPGFLAFREVPTVLKALTCLSVEPDLLMVDGQGVAHPRRMGIAAHLGAVTDLPAIGVAKSRLTGTFEGPDFNKFSMSPLTDKNELIGTVLRSKEKCNPLFISAGHRVSQQTALDITLECFRGYRLPEPTRIADAISKWKLTGADERHFKENSEKSPLPQTGDLFG